MEKIALKSLKIPPWSGQSVRSWVRFLAWIFMLFALIAGVIGTYFIIQDGAVAANHLPLLFFGLIGEVYFFALLLHVGIKGVAPSTWLPWK